MFGVRIRTVGDTEIIVNKKPPSIEPDGSDRFPQFSLADKTLPPPRWRRALVPHPPLNSLAGKAVHCPGPKSTKIRGFGLGPKSDCRQPPV